MNACMRRAGLDPPPFPAGVEKKVAGRDPPYMSSILIVLLLSSCGSSPAPGDATPQAVTEARSCHPEWPVVAHHAGGEAVLLPAGAALPVSCATETGYASSESTIAVSGDGTLIYSPAQTENSMARSRDGGLNWSLTYPAVAQPSSFWNTLDPYLIADRRTGHVFWAHATGPVRNQGGLPQGAGFYLAAAYGFQVFTSADNGFSWTTADYQTAPTGDWEQLMVGPPPPLPTGADQPAGYPNIVYLCANSPVEVSGPGRLCYKSLDGGASFVMAGYVSPTASNPQDICPPLNFHNGVVDSLGTIYIPTTCQQSDYLIVSQDEGASWVWKPMPDAPTGTVISGGWLQLALDDADNLYAMWPEGGQLFLQISRDHAQTWSAPLMVAAPGVSNVQRPVIKGGAPGQVGISYYASVDPAAAMLSAYITQTLDALAPQPLFYSGALNDPAVPIFHDGGLTGGEPRLDFIGGAYDMAGTSFWAGVVKQYGPPDAGNKIATTGYVGRLAFDANVAARLP